MDKNITDSISLKFLKSHALFGGIEDDDLVFFLSLMKQGNHSGGDVIVSEGETGDCLYLIVEGSVEILKVFPIHHQNQWRESLPWDQEKLSERWRSLIYRNDQRR